MTKFKRIANKIRRFTWNVPTETLIFAITITLLGIILVKYLQL